MLFGITGHHATAIACMLPALGLAMLDDSALVGTGGEARAPLDGERDDDLGIELDHLE